MGPPTLQGSAQLRPTGSLGAPGGLRRGVGLSPLFAKLRPSGFINEQAFGSVHLAGDHLLLPTGFVNEQAFGVVTLNEAGKLRPTGFANEQAFGEPSLAHLLGATGFINEQAFGDTALRLVMPATGFANEQAFGSPALSHVIAATGFANTQAFGEPALVEPPSSAAVEATTVDNTGGAFQTSLTVSHNNPVGSNKLLVFVLAGKTGTDAMTGLGVTYNSVSMTHKGGDGISRSGGGGTRTEAHLFELDDPATGANNIVVTSDDSNRITVVAYSLSNAGTLGTVATDTEIAPSSGSFNFDLAVASSEGQLVLWGLSWRDSGSSLTFGTGQTGVDDQDVREQNSRGGASWKAGSATSTTMDATLTESGGDANRVAKVGVAVAGA